MKIYFAYRSAYTSNHRFIKEFEAESILDFFQKNWKLLCGNVETLKQFLGFYVYGLPIHTQENPPKTLKKLKEILKEGVYLEKIFVHKDCITVMTDDDEIMLSWAIFTENYIQKHPLETNIWLTNPLPTNASENTQISYKKGQKIIQKGKEKCNTYYFSSVIYDGCNLEDLAMPVIINGVSLPNLCDFLVENSPLKFNDNDAFYYQKRELLFLQQIAINLSLEKNTQNLINEFSTYILSDIFEKISIEEISTKITPEYLSQTKNQNPKTICNISEHFVEIMIRGRYFYDYIVLFDDYWYNQHETLAKSLINFYQKAMLNRKY